MPLFARLNSATDVAIVDPHRTVTWGEVDDAVNRCANRLVSACVGADRRAAVFAENAAETALAHASIITAGCSAVPVNFHLNASEAAYIIEDSKADIVFADASTVERAIEAAASAGVDTVVVWGELPADLAAAESVTSWSDWLAAGAPEDPDLSRPPLPSLMYTSGTTGRPKATELPPTMFPGGADVAEYLEKLGEASYAQLGTHLVVGPMYHTGPLVGVRTLCAGVKLVILGRFDGEKTLAAIDEHATTGTVMVPTHFVRLLALPEHVRDRYDVSSMVQVGSTGSRFPAEVFEAMIDWWGPVFTDAYGASEVGTVCRITAAEWLEHRGSVGQTQPGFTAHILDEDLNELPTNTEGLLYFRDETGRGIVYPNDAEKTAAANPEPGLFTLGEVGFVDDDGYVFITDRASDMVVSGGVNLYPAEAEQILIDHPSIADVACVGLPDPVMGETLCALVQPEADVVIDLDELSLWLRERLSTQKCPRKWDTVSHLGRNTMGKISKRKLRDAYLAGELA